MLYFFTHSPFSIPKQWKTVVFCTLCYILSSVLMRCSLSYIISKRKVTNIYFHFIMLSKLSAVKNIQCVLVPGPVISQIQGSAGKNIFGWAQKYLRHDVTADANTTILLLTRIHGHDEMHDIRSAFCLLKWSGFCSSWNFGSTYVKHLNILAFYNWKLEQRRKLNHIWFIYPNFLQPFH